MVVSFLEGGSASNLLFQRAPTETENYKAAKAIMNGKFLKARTAYTFRAGKKTAHHRLIIGNAVQSRSQLDFSAEAFDLRMQVEILKDPELGLGQTVSRQRTAAGKFRAVERNTSF